MEKSDIGRTDGFVAGSDAVRENLGMSGMRLSHEYEKRIAFLCDMADNVYSRLCNAAEDDVFLCCTDDNVRRTYAEAMSMFRADTRDADAVNFHDVAFRSGLLSRADRYFVCKKTVEKTGRKYTAENFGQVLFGDCPALSPANRKIAFVRNMQSGKAFECFAKYVFGAMTAYRDSFALACESVADGECSYGILPLRNSVDGRLGAFYKMLDKHELGVLLCCDIVNKSGDVTRYALVYARNGILSAHGDLKLECRISFENPADISGLTEMAEFFGIAVDSIDGVSDGRGGAGKSFSVCFSLSGPDVAGFIFCLQSEYPQVLPIMLYTQTEGAEC